MLKKAVFPPWALRTPRNSWICQDKAQTKWAPGGNIKGVQGNTQNDDWASEIQRNRRSPSEVIRGWKSKHQQKSIQDRTHRKNQILYSYFQCQSTPLLQLLPCSQKWIIKPKSLCVRCSQSGIGSGFVNRSSTAAGRGEEGVEEGWWERGGEGQFRESRNRRGEGEGVEDDGIEVVFKDSNKLVLVFKNGVWDWEADVPSEQIRLVNSCV